ncbi:MAG: hybrid sensor histidine kinase/response regulator [Xenococcus sp. MO_188.B8]|nr:hybrid sensor histidine kinase/response regulator [Xenococcus sp. MO_188.B8]
MMDSENRDYAYQFFLEEAPELLQILETGLLDLQQDSDPAKIHDLMRAAHSLKGGAATVGLNGIKTIAHRLETIFKALYVEKEIDTELETLLLKAYDCLRSPLNEQITTGSYDEESALANADSTLKLIETRLGDALLEADNYVPSSTDLGVDLVASIFETDVVQGIEHLSKIIAAPQEYELETELRTQAEVFVGFAEMLSLPGFGAIASGTLDALNANPAAVLEIATVALDDFLAAKELVLGGDRDCGGSPSETLLAFSQEAKLQSVENPVIAPGLQDSIAAEAFIELEPSNIIDIEQVLGDEDEPTGDSIPLETLLESSQNTKLQLIEDLEPAAMSEAPSKAAASIEAEPPNIIAMEQVLEDKDEPAGESSLSEALFDSSQDTKLQLIEDFEPASMSEDSSAAAAPIESELSKIAADSSSSSLGLVRQSASAASAPASPEPKEPETGKQPAQLKPAANLKIRVDSQRLEKINNFVGELVINRNSQALQQEQLQTILSKFQDRLEQFNRLTYQFQEISDRISVAPSHNSSNDTTSLGDFDALEMDRYGKVYSLIQEIVEETMQFEEAVDDFVLFKRQSEDTIKQQHKTLSRLGEELMWARMMPLKQLLGAFPRALRDLSVKYQKPVNFKMSGTEVLVDKGILEKLHDPLLHLLRNAFDHGIESPEVRRQQGKPENGQIDVCAYHQGNRTLIEIKDDGRGLDVEKIARRAIDKGWLSVKELAEIDHDKLLDFIFEPGFSTAEEVSDLSGRGVGLNVVRSQLEEIKGIVTLNSTLGKGTTFTLSLPLSQTISSMLICLVDSSAVAIPAANVQEVIFPKADSIKRSGNQRVLSWREQLLPVYRLNDLLEYRYPSPICSRSKAFSNISGANNDTLPLLIINQGQDHFALEAEGLGQEQELVIKPLTGAIATPKYIYGCTILGDGILVPAIAPTALLAYIREQKSANPAHYENLTALTALRKKNVIPTALAVDDSAMMRRILTRTLEKVGYRVLTAKDGWEALELLNRSSQVQLIVSDLEMPNLNGLELLHRLRQDAELSKIPVAMLTSRSNDKHRNLAMTLGASAYLTKPYIEQEFLDELKKIFSDRQPLKPSLSPPKLLSSSAS